MFVCTLFEQFVNIPPMSHHVLDENHFSRVNKFEGFQEFFFSSVKYAIFMLLERRKETMKLHVINMKMIKFTQVTVIDLLVFLTRYVKKHYQKKN